MSEVTNQLFNIVENCQEFEERQASSAVRASFKGLLKDAPGESTAIANGLSQQLIYQMTLILPDAIVSCDDLKLEPGEAAFPLLQPSAKQALQRAIQARGKVMILNSGYRTLAQQMLLFNWYNGISPVAAPGASNHQSGLALDIEDPRGWEPYLLDQGWQPLPGDPPHFDYVAGGTRDIRSTAILAFQQLWNKNNSTQKITEDGSYGAQTGNALNRSPASGFAKAPWDTQPRTLRLSRPRMEGSDVVKLQQRLQAAGVAVEVDGEFGPATDKAVKELQKRKSLVTDGVVGSKTREHLA